MPCVVIVLNFRTQSEGYPAPILPVSLTRDKGKRKSGTLMSVGDSADLGFDLCKQRFVCPDVPEFFWFENTDFVFIRTSKIESDSFAERVECVLIK